MIGQKRIKPGEDFFVFRCLPEEKRVNEKVRLAIQTKT